MGAFYEKDEMNPFRYNYCGKMCMTVLCRTIVRRNDLFGYEMRVCQNTLLITEDRYIAELSYEVAI